MLAEIAGLEGVSLQPAAGAHGEFTALLVAAAYFRDLGQERPVVLIPDGAHGTNPASAVMAGFRTVPVKSTPEGFVDVDDLAAHLDNAHGRLHDHQPEHPGDVRAADRRDRPAGARRRRTGLPGRGEHERHPRHRPARRLRRRPDALQPAQDLQRSARRRRAGGGADRGRRQAGPVSARADRRPRRSDGYRLDYERPKSIGRVRSFFGNVGVLVRMYCYLLTHGPDGLRRVAENAVLNANYLLARVKHILPAPQGDRCMHEFVASAAQLKAERGVAAMDIAKRLLDYGFHAPTVYFPLIVKEAVMIEPTETESKATLDAFAEALFRITEEAPETLHDAPHTTPISRPDEVRAARQPVLRWKGGEAGDLSAQK